jgi:hypothetical protein
MVKLADSGDFLEEVTRGNVSQGMWQVSLQCHLSIWCPLLTDFLATWLNSAQEVFSNFRESKRGSGCLGLMRRRLIDDFFSVVASSNSSRSGGRGRHMEWGWGGVGLKVRMRSLICSRGWSCGLWMHRWSHRLLGWGGVTSSSHWAACPS